MIGFSSIGKLKENSERLGLSLILVLTFSMGFSLQAQERLSNPLVPSYGFTMPNYLGGFIGIGNNFQKGKYLVDCPSCEFEGGNGFDLVLGINRSWGIDKGLYFDLGVAYESVNLTSTFREVEQLTDKTYGKTFFAEFKNEGNINLGIVRLIPEVRYNFFKILFTKVGLNTGLVMANNLKHTQTPVSETVNVPGLGEVFLDTQGNVRQDGPVKNLNTFQAGLNLDLGMFFLIKNTTKISPSIQYYIPFTEIIDNGFGFSVPTLRFMIEVNFKTNTTEGDSLYDVE